MYIYKEATLNINGITQQTRLKMLEDFLMRHDIDLTLLQEVKCPQLDILSRYAKNINIGSGPRGTALLAKHGITLTNVKKLPTGRGIAAMFNETWFVNYTHPPVLKKTRTRKFL
jgi:exonuclease III